MSFVILGFLISGFSCNRCTIYRDSCPTGNGIINTIWTVLCLVLSSFTKWFLFKPFSTRVKGVVL